MRLVLLGAALLGACAAHGEETSAAQTARDFPVGGFDRVALTGSQNVIVTVGGAASVRAEGDAEAIERLDIRVEDGQLRIGSRRQSGWSWGGRRNRVTIHVSAPALAAAAVTGSGNMRVDRVEGQSFDATVTGSGDLRVAAIRVREASFTVTGSGNLAAAGAAAQSRVDVTGSGNADLAEIDSETAEVRVRGSGNANLRATRTASVVSTGSGNVTVDGGARCSVTKRGSGDVRCG